MPEPILIIHGVANHDKEPFLQAVAELAQKLGSQWELIPVFWGDLGGKSEDITDCLPIFQDGRWSVRSESAEQPTSFTRADVGTGLLTNAARAQLIASAMTPASINPVRSSTTIQSKVVQAAYEELSNTKVIQYVDNPAILQSLSQTINTALEPTSNNNNAPGTTSFYPVRSSTYSSETRGLGNHTTEVVKRVIHSVDDMLGQFLGDRLGQINQNIRGSVVIPLAEFCGDILVYQRNQALIQQRIWDTLTKHGQGYGTEEKPVHAIAHSLGGVITFDTAVQPSEEGKRLWLKSLTTFGSQAAFFHIVDKRQSLTKYKRDKPVELPPTIGRWVNLVNPGDFLAFTASTVFRLHNGSEPSDLSVKESLSNLISSKAWTHSTYWRSDELISALKEVALLP